MDTIVMNTEGGQQEKMLDTAPASNDTVAPMNFSEVTPCQFGISVQSFIPQSSSPSKCTDKSRLAQIKARRRSSVGVRGSPETNSLIRFIAQQRMKTPPANHTLQHVRSSPFLPHAASTLRQKIAAFHSLMDEDESEACNPVPRQDSSAGRCIRTRDYLSDGASLDSGKENHPPRMTPTPSKRRRLGPCEVEISEASTPILPSLKEQEENEEPLTPVLTKGPLPSSEIVEEVQSVYISPPHVDLELHTCFPTKNQQNNAFELQSLSQLPPDDPAASSPAQPATSLHISSFPSLLEMKSTGNDSTGASTFKKKKVRFGGPLSPELFDKNLPPSTPLQKGGTPARAPTPGGSFQLRSLLKTPQRNEAQTPQAQPDLSSPTVFGASPIFAKSGNHRPKCLGEFSEDKDGKIVFPSIEEIDCVVMSDTECTWEARPLNLNMAFHEESLSQIVTESETKHNKTSKTDVLDEPEFLPEKQQPEAGVDTSAPVRHSNRRKKQPEPECDSTTTSAAPARSSSRKRKQPEESQPVKRSVRSAAKSASGKMKMTSTVTRRWNKEVDRSLYGSREYASKIPTLSPITERLSFTSQAIAAPESPSINCTGPNQESHLNLEKLSGTQATDDFTLTNALETPAEDLVTFPHLVKERVRITGKGSRLSGPSVKERRTNRRKISVADSGLLSQEPQDHTSAKTEEHCKDQTTPELEESNKMPWESTVPEQGGVHVELNAQTSADTPSIDWNSTSESAAGLNVCPPLAKEPSCIMPAQPVQRKAKRGRRSSVSSSVLQELGGEVEDHQMSHAAEGNGQGDQAASQHESKSSTNSQVKEGLGQMDLAPWQADFNFEDVFKIVATRGQRSVRRSLRNKNTIADSSNSAGLTWLPLSSPESSRVTRRRTKGRQVGDALSVQSSLPVEAQDNAS
ncbi:cell division cycle-associated protein 2 isoform X2 [Mastacembelus armatus]|uniref:Cell division cycle associated 2 n=1 Tax=Mastacembelus armatus TaxID=205130 RepID=A0A3Q3SUF9_9TELE|nr:cell division cycle-associated protein 2-like isoform X2 [Mastacembelus armatus]